MNTKSVSTKPEGNAINTLLTAVFSTKKQIVRVNDNKYAARFRKWYKCSWTYIGIDAYWSKHYLYKSFVLCDTEEEANAKLASRFPKLTVLNGD